MFCKCLILSLFPAISVSRVKCVPLLLSLHVWKYYIAHVIGCCSSRLVFFSFPFSRSPYSFYYFPVLLWGFPNSSSGEGSTCNAGDPSSIPGLGRSTGEGIGYPLQYSWTFLEAQLVKNLPAMRVTWAQPLGREDPLEKEGPPTPVFWPGEFHGLYRPWDCKESDMTEWYLHYLKSESEVVQLCVTICDPWTVAYQAPPYMGFSRQE